MTNGSIENASHWHWHQINYWLRVEQVVVRELKICKPPDGPLIFPKGCSTEASHQLMNDGMPVHAGKGKKARHAYLDSGVYRAWGYHRAWGTSPLRRSRMDIVTETYPNLEYIFFYDNASTRLKHTNGVLSARNGVVRCPNSFRRWNKEWKELPMFANRSPYSM